MPKASKLRLLPLDPGNPFLSCSDSLRFTQFMGLEQKGDFDVLNHQLGYVLLID